MVRRLLSASLLVAASACSFQHGSLTGGGDDGGPRDSAIDAPPDAPPDAFDPLCYGKGGFYVCLSTAPTMAISFTNAIDTTACRADTDGGLINGTVVAVGSATMVCMFAGTSITIGSTLAGAFGDKPLLLIASGNISIPVGTTLDARSAAYPTVGNPSNGPGANPSACGTPPDGAAGAGGAGGGGGGTFGSKGGNGGDGGAGAGGQAAAVPTSFTTLRGGCPGGKGGMGGAGSARANGGAGGGAVAMFARGNIQIDGSLTVSGAGGGGGQASKGGAGGGGSGGMIVLQAAAIAIGTTGQMQANGGGGGAGAGNGQDGDHGQDAITFDMAASGGIFSTSGATPGGAGAFKSTGAVTPANSGNGGPGGGGGVGVIRVLSGQTLPVARISPPQS